MTDRARSFLTESDRAYLRGESDLTEGSEYNKERHIRERTRQAIRDFSLLFEHFDWEWYLKIFSGDDCWLGGEDDEFREGCRDTLAFVWRGTGMEQTIDNNSGIMPPAELLFKEAIYRVAEKGGYRIHEVGFPDNIIDGEPEPPSLEERVSSGDLPEDMTIRELFNHEDIDEDVFIDTLQKAIDKESSK